MNPASENSVTIMEYKLWMEYTLMNCNLSVNCAF